MFLLFRGFETWSSGMGGRTGKLFLFCSMLHAELLIKLLQASSS